MLHGSGISTSIHHVIRPLEQHGARAIRFDGVGGAKDVDVVAVVHPNDAVLLAIRHQIDILEQEVLRPFGDHWGNTVDEGDGLNPW